MTDNEIIKALECCFINNNCTGCPLQSPPTEECLKVACSSALDLIKRQQAEIERLTDLLVCSAESERNAVGIMHELEAEVEKFHPYNLHYGNLRMEIAREVCDRLITTADLTQLDSFNYAYLISQEHIDNLLKEMENENGKLD